MTPAHVKRLFRSAYQLDLSQTALGYQYLFEALQDPRLRDICLVETRWRGHTIVKKAEPPGLLAKILWPVFDVQSVEARLRMWRDQLCGWLTSHKVHGPLGRAFGFSGGTELDKPRPLPIRWMAGLLGWVL